MREGWELKKMSDLFDVKSSKRVHKSDWKKDGIPFYRAREVVKLARNGFVDNDLFISNELYNEFTKEKGAPQEGDIIISAVGTLGQCYLVKESDKFYFKDASVLWFENVSNVNPTYIEYAFKSDLIMSQVMHKSMGATVGTLTISRAKIIQIPVPPLQEQKQIVAILDKAFAAIDQAKANIEKNIENAKELFQSKLNEIFSQKGEDWEELPIKELTTLVTKGSSPNWQGINYVENGGIFFLTSKNVGEGKLLLANKKYLESKFNDIQKKSILKKGDVLTNIVGASIGRTAIFDLTEITNINQAVCLMRCIPDKISNQYLMHVLNSPYFKAILHDNEVDNARANLSLTFFKNLIIPLPKIHDQKEIVAHIEHISSETRALETTYKQKVKSLVELKKSILQKAFAGELTN